MKRLFHVRWKRGYDLFFQQGCVQSMSPWQQLHRQFVPQPRRRLRAEDLNVQDVSARSAISKNAADEGAFKTPTLQGTVRVTRRRHDGSVATLKREVGGLYSRGRK